MVRVKICGLTNEEDIEWALEFGADAVGFVGEPSSKRFLPEDRLDELVRHAGPIPVTVSVYGIYSRIKEPVSTYVQATTFETNPGIQRFQVVHLLSKGKEGNVAAYLIDATVPGEFGGTGKTADWDLAAEFVREHEIPTILAGGLTSDNVAEAIHKVRPYGVDVSSGVETSPGKKDKSKLRDFIQAVRSTA